MAKLYVISGYRNMARGFAFNAGDIIDVDDDIKKYLLADSPKSFSSVVSKASKSKQRTAPRKPPVDKAVK